jgi:prolyl 4-hydroxylase
MKKFEPIEINDVTTFICQDYVSDEAVNQAIQAYDCFTPNRGKTGYNIDSEEVDTTKKDSFDVTIVPNDCLLIQNEIRNIYSKYVYYYHLEKHIPPLYFREHYNIQKYPLNGAFHSIHADRGYGPIDQFRELVWMTYLNDVHSGGETEFMFYKLKVQPRKGLTLIWPAGWTHIHRGLPSPTTEKIIATGWLSP